MILLSELDRLEGRAGGALIDVRMYSWQCATC